MKSNRARIVVVGGGPAGLIAAGSSAYSGGDVIILEKGPMVARKLLISGKGRCNLTNTASMQQFIEAFGRNGKFLYGAFSRFFREDLLQILASEGLECKEERGGRVFPATDRSADVAAAIQNWVAKSGSKVKTGCRAICIVMESGQAAGVKITGGEIKADAVIIATGGLSYPRTGSTGDGYRMAAELGHSIVKPRAALAPVLIKEDWVGGLAGLSLRNVNVKLIAIEADQTQHVVAEEFGEMLFTHVGVSGPVILTLSREVPDLLEKGNAELSIDLKPALSSEQLHAKFIRDFRQTQHLRNYLKTLLPNLLAQSFAGLLDIDSGKPLNKITAAERALIVQRLKDLRVTIKDLAPIEEAIVTAGGVALDEVDPRTMMSRLVAGLFFAGEVMDIDARTGGYNLQAAFSTGYTAGRSAAQYAMNKKKDN